MLKPAPMTVEQIVRLTPFPDEQPDEAEYWTPTEWKELRLRWEGYRGPVRSTSHFALAVPFKRRPEYNSVIQYRQGELIIDVMHDDELQDIEQLLTVVDPVSQMKAESVIQPNDKCPCDSGKKHKKCCGRFM